MYTSKTVFSFFKDAGSIDLEVVSMDIILEKFQEEQFSNARIFVIQIQIVKQLSTVLLTVEVILNTNLETVTYRVETIMLHVMAPIGILICTLREELAKKVCQYFLQTNKKDFGF